MENTKGKLAGYWQKSGEKIVKAIKASEEELLFLHLLDLLNLWKSSGFVNTPFKENRGERTLMTHRYERRLDRILNPTNYENNCHQNIPGNGLSLIQQWHSTLKLDDKSPATRCDYLEKVSIFLRNGPNKQPADVEKKHCQNFLAEKSKSGRRTYKATLRQFFLWYYLDYKQADQSKVPRFVDTTLKVTGSAGKDKVSEENIPSEEDVETLLNNAWTHRDRALIALLADKGMRISEALALDIKDVNYDKAGIYLMVPEAKKDYESYRKNRLTWSRPALKDWLEAHPRQNEEEAPLFVKLQLPESEEKHSRMKYGAARQMMQTLRERAGVSESISLHSFRHYSTTQDRQKKHLRDSYIIDDKGWDDPSMLERYDHLTDDTVDRAHIKQMVEEGQLEKEVLEEIESGGKGEKTKLKLIRCPSCNTKNSPERDYCDQCSQPFSDDGIEEQERLKRLAREVMEETGALEEMEEKIMGEI